MSNADRELFLGFARALAAAREFAETHNSSLPRWCPACGDEGHIPGLLCPGCGYRHRIAWAIVRDTEWGYDVVSIADRRQVLAKFSVH